MNIFFIFFFLVFPIIHSQSLTFQLFLDSKKYNGNPYIRLPFGTPKQFIELVLDNTKSMISLISSDFDENSITSFNPNLTSSFERIPGSLTSLFFEDGEIFGDNFIDFLQLSKPIPFIMLLVQRFSLPRDSFDNLLGLKMMGISNDERKVKRNLINGLYSNEMIKNRIFGYWLKQKTFFIGEVPEELQKKKKYKCSCNYDINDWNCYFNEIYTESSKLYLRMSSKSNFVKIISRKNTISFPQEFGEPLLNYFLSINLIGENCELIENNEIYGKIQKIICQEFDTKLINEGLNFIFEGGFKLQLPSDKLFIKSPSKKGKMNFIIESHEKNKYFVLGEKFLFNNVLIYNMNDKSITIIPENDNFKMGNITKYFLILNCLILFIGLMIETLNKNLNNFFLNKKNLL